MEDSVHTSEVMASIEVPMQFCYTLILGIDIVRRLVQEDVKVLKLTAKEGTSTNELTFDGQTVWEDKKKLCSSAILYLDGEKPTLAVLVTRDNKNNKQGTVYRYHDGKQWKDGNENKHKTKFGELKEKYKHTLISLNIVKPDGSNIDVHTETESGVSFKGYSLKEGHHMSSVLDGDKELWKSSGDGQKCKLVESYSKGNITIIYLETSDNSGTKSKYFEKLDGVWKEIDEEPFNEKAKTFIGESRRDGLTLDIAHPNIVLFLHESLSATKGSVIVSYLLHEDLIKALTLHESRGLLLPPGLPNSTTFCILISTRSSPGFFAGLSYILINLSCPHNSSFLGIDTLPPLSFLHILATWEECLGLSIFGPHGQTPQNHQRCCPKC
ncbi:hypothetical protein BEWA_046710 [Theileria equi strain WA]|uniref:Uncharacterized protein n=1 Tax=Theileria equi strain WA TaxID=1537102 RepID=L1L9V2_THEEQ|nr:hypothetical protein BEWA_046710 [Theileria equi strain WA]EKX72207.1 hypothetical protein BEWA_046710 [Theileria equi strain WA]|eukprot:XP_004831659.1 hypothetical protein BEWA_046710 [Theileria equi strain WA]